MKKIINNLVYNTETAVLVGEKEYISSNSDVSTFELYRKKTGEYFSYTWSTSIFSAGEQIRPLSLNEAMEFAETHISADEYIEEFNPAETDENKRQISLTLKPETIAVLEQVRAETRKSISQQIDEYAENIK